MYSRLGNNYFMPNWETATVVPTALDSSFPGLLHYLWTAVLTVSQLGMK